MSAGDTAKDAKLADRKVAVRDEACVLTIST